MPPRHRFLEPIHNVKDEGEPPIRGRSREMLVFISGNMPRGDPHAVSRGEWLSPIRLRNSGGGASRDRTDDLKLAKLALSQLSYGPIRMVRMFALVRLPLTDGGPSRS
jgi:hypothetical protein